MSEYKECPYCAEKILARAVKCKHCQSTIEETPDSMSAAGNLKKEENLETTEAQSPQRGEAQATAPPPPPPPPPANQQPAPPAPPGERRSSPWKTVAIVFGSLVGLAALGFIGLVVYNMINPAAIKVTSVSTAPAVTAEGRPVSATGTFYPDAGEIYVAFEVENAPGETRLTSTWYYEDADYRIDSATIDIPRGSSTPYFYLYMEEWPEGSYRVDLSVGGEIIATARFEVIMETGTITYTWEKEGVAGEYQGQLLSGVPHGYGSWRGTNETEYSGGWAYGYAEGYGTHESPLHSYEGEWSQDEMHGYGSLTFYDNNNITNFTGEFENDVPHGFGTLTFHGEITCFLTNRVYNEGIVTGPIQNGEFHGDVTIEFPDGTILEGPVHYEDPYGRWIITNPDGTTQEGEWVDGEFVLD